MSIHTHSASGVTLVEQAGDRLVSANSGDGRLDILSTNFKCVETSHFPRKAKLDEHVRKSFAPYSPHPHLSGYYVLPGTVRAAAPWHGIATFDVDYIGVNDWPRLPDAWLETSETEKMVLDSAAAGLKLLSLSYERFYIQCVHFGEVSQPETARLINRVYRVAEIGGGAENLLALERVETIARHGPWSVFRLTFIPRVIASMRLNYGIVRNRIERQSLTDVNIDALLENGEPGSGETAGSGKNVKLLRFDRCTKTDSFFSRL